MKYDVESILEMYEDDYIPSSKVPVPRNIKLAEIPRSEMDNFNTPDLEQSPDSFLKPGETLEDFDVTFRRPNAQGGMQQLVQPNADGSRPGYGGEVKSTKHLGTTDKNYSGVYEETYKKGTKSYYGKYIRDGQAFKKNFKNKDDALKFVTEGRKKPPAKSVIDIQSESGTLLEQPKYKTNLTKALDEVTALQEKGYGNIDEIVKKYQKIFTQKVGSKTKTGKTVKTGVGSTEYKAITFAIREHANKLGIQSINNSNVIKALDAYSKIKNPKRGDIPKILKKYNAPAGTFNKYLQEDKLNLRKKIPLQFGSEAEKKKYYAKLRNNAINEFSSKKFEKFLSAPETSLVQKSHLGDLYNQYVRTGNLGYAPNLINQETLKDVDAILKEYNEQINDLFKNKPKGYRNKIDLLNQKGNDLAAATQGYKKFTGRDPFTGKEFTINFSKPSQELDPTNLLKNKKLSDLTAADKPTLEMLKEDAIKNAKLSKKETNKISKEILSQLEKLGCGKSAGGRIMFGEGTSCAIKGRKVLEQGLKNGFKESDQVLANTILKSGRFLKDAVSLRGLFGPAALAFTAAAEAGIVGYDMLATGKSFREAIGDSLFNYALGDKTKIDSDEEFIKRLKNIKVGPQDYQRMGEAEIGKMLNFKTNLDDMNKGFNLYDQLNKVNQKIEDNTLNQAIDPSFFSNNAFQLDAQKNKIQADIQDYNRTNTPNRVTDYLLSPAATEGANASTLANLLVKQDQLKDAGTGGGLPKIDQGIAKDLKQTQYNLDKLLNPTKLDEFGEYFISRPQSEQSYMMGLGYKEGGIASLNVNKK